MSMPLKMEVPVLSVDAGKMHKVDTRNVESLHSMWSVFSKCAASVENGRRLENLSWRVWNRETLCCESPPQFTTIPTVDIYRLRPKRKDLPDLSTSVDSVVSDRSALGGQSQHSSTAPLDIKKQASARIEPTLSTSRGKEKNLTPLALEKMVCSIQKTQEACEPLSPTIADAVPSVFTSTDITPRPQSPTINVPLHSSESSSSTAPFSSPESDKSTTNTIASDTSAELVTSTHSIVRGFSPSQVSSSYRSNTHLAPSQPVTKSIPHAKNEDGKKAAKFILGGGSSGDEESSFEESMKSQITQSSLTAGLKATTGKAPLGNKKLSFRDEVMSRNLNRKSHEEDKVFESSDDDDEIPDSAIDDDSEEDEFEEGADEDWEDDRSDNDDSTANDTPLFHKVDSQPNLVSRRSLLTTLMHQTDRAAAFTNMASKSSPALKRSRTLALISPTMDTIAQEPATSAHSEAVPTGSKPITMTTSNTNPMTLSPRTTRRNMLASEMTESLRKHVLHERQQKKSTATAVLKRRHTAHDVANLKTYPGEEDEDGIIPGHNKLSKNHYFAQGLLDYHQAGW